MSKTIFQGRDAARQALASGAESAATPWRRVPVRVVAAGLVVVVAGGLGVAWTAGAFSPGDLFGERRATGAGDAAGDPAATCHRRRR